MGHSYKCPSCKTGQQEYINGVGEICDNLDCPTNKCGWVFWGIFFAVILVIRLIWDLLK